CENIFDFFFNLYTPRVSAVVHGSDLRWLTPLLTMGSFLGPKYGFCPDNSRAWVEELRGST
ncbi:hypothetical protein, partial [Microcoleus vaginatus]|uniref:hypothetical protein n=1 Tax=Microcoleus vaginatus TaxID=119532 RepID=UPI0032AB84D2